MFCIVFKRVRITDFNEILEFGHMHNFFWVKILKKNHFYRCFSKIFWKEPIKPGNKNCFFFKRFLFAYIPCSGLKSTLSGLKSAPSGLKSARADLWTVRTGLRPKKADFRPERADFKVWEGRFQAWEGRYQAWEGRFQDWEGLGGWTDEQKSICVQQDFVPFRAAALNKRKKKKKKKN